MPPQKHPSLLREAHFYSLDPLIAKLEVCAGAFMMEMVLGAGCIWCWVLCLGCEELTCTHQDSIHPHVLRLLIAETDLTPRPILDTLGMATPH